MKYLILALPGATPSLLFEDERLDTIRRLMDGGCYGALTPEPDASAITPRWRYLRASLAAAGERILDVLAPSVDDLPTNDEHFGNYDRVAYDEFQVAVNDAKWGFAEIVDDRFSRSRASGAGDAESPEALGDLALRFDLDLGRVLELADDETIVLIFSDHAAANTFQPGCFVLASTNNPLNGAVEGVWWSDLEPTLLELGGYPIPESFPGRSRVAGMMLADAERPDLSAEEEEMLRERLSALGYIG